VELRRAVSSTDVAAKAAIHNNNNNNNNNSDDGDNINTEGSGIIRVKSAVMSLASDLD
jgi:hypothetical protein